MKKSAYYPPADRILDLFGMEFPPATFWKFHTVTLTAGIFFGCFWGIFMSSTAWRNYPLKDIFMPSIVGGILFGLAMATNHLRIKKKLGITTWGDFKKRRDRA